MGGQLPPRARQEMRTIDDTISRLLSDQEFDHLPELPAEHYDPEHGYTSDPSEYTEQDYRDTLGDE